ncbi:hypothetical protein HAX54_005022, partial [Datura stramonium]|nr:hypothetical protein [Datura stramonium]
MASKVNKGKGVASSSHGSKRARRPSEEEHEDVRMARPPLRQYGLHWGNSCKLDAKGEVEPLKLGGQINIEFAPMALNRLLGTPHVDPQPFVDMVKKPRTGILAYLQVALTR